MNNNKKITMDYQLNGNISKKYDVSDKDYVYSKKVPNALEFILESKGEISSMKQDITYNAYNLIEIIKEGQQSRQEIHSQIDAFSPYHILKLTHYHIGTLASLIVPLNEAIVQLNGVIVQLNGAIVPLNGAIVPLNGAIVPLNGVFVPLNGVFVPLNGVIVPLNGVIVQWNGVIVPVNFFTSKDNLLRYRELKDLINYTLVLVFNACGMFFSFITTVLKQNK